ncbi:DUF5605 domain-containing protein [Saccharomonospora sp. NPDC046836]|uniref:DUF5605 domain-containing protein n=1 Tax=Saccharomonospora sp. NPDC046836 TaxID=3156921 RepID=UPI0033CA3B63
MFSARTPLQEVLHDDRARAILTRVAPELIASRVLHILHQYPVELVLRTEASLMDRPEVWTEAIREIEALPPAEPPAREPSRIDFPRGDVEDPATPRASASFSVAGPARVGGRVEISLQGPSGGNPFIDVVLDAFVDDGTDQFVVPGFYDGDGIYRVRVLAQRPGTLRFELRSNARSIDGIAGTIAVDDDHDARGLVRPDGFHFRYDNGERYLPIGTTAYAWTHQPEELQDSTVKTLARSPFNKMRMCLFPKSYMYNQNEPERYPFVKTDDGWDPARFDTVYFGQLERRIDELAALGIEADLILFHPYDRWGFSAMSRAEDVRYVRYVVARLAAFPTVWWSLANEWDIVFTKSVPDWDAIAAAIRENDPYGHLTSIHNCRAPFDQSREWITHVSMQRIDVYRTAEDVEVWRQWGKPVVVDECGYEGDLDQGWGNISGEEMTRRFWEGAIRGGYIGHGETYLNPAEDLWWSKGGELVGSSPARIAFLREILEQAPVLEPAPINWDVPRAGTEGEYFLYYFGATRPTFRRFVLDPATAYQVDVIDTWNMTITELPGTFRGRFQIDLPGVPYIAVRMSAATDGAPGRAAP